MIGFFFFLYGEKTCGFSLILLQVTLFHDILHHNEDKSMQSYWGKFFTYKGKQNIQIELLADSSLSTEEKGNKIVQE